MEQQDWRVMLREARKSMRLTQKQLADLAGLSLETIRGYEGGSRSPRREHLISLLEELKIDRGWRNRFLMAAGFAPDGLEQRPPDIHNWMFTEEEAQREIDSYPWPSFVLSERAQVIAANQLVQRLWGVDLRYEYMDPVERNLLSVATDPYFADRVVNWLEAVSTIAMVFKSFHRGPEQPEAASPYFSAVIEHFMKGDPKYVNRFVEVWQQASGEPMAKLRWSYPVHWREPGVGDIRFRCIVSSANEYHGWAYNDWIPTDAESWANVERLRCRDDGGAK